MGVLRPPYETHHRYHRRGVQLREEHDMADHLEKQKNNAESVPHNDGRLISENSGQFGVSDKRRAQLSQMEQDAGVQHEAPDESVPSRSDEDRERDAALASQPGAARPGDKH